MRQFAWAMVPVIALLSCGPISAQQDDRTPAGQPSLSGVFQADPGVFQGPEPAPRPGLPPPFVPPAGSALIIQNGEVVMQETPPVTWTPAPPPTPGSIRTACVSGPHPRPGETVPQIQWRACQMAGCYLCPDGRPFSAPRDSIPAEWLPN